jgi:hypothetical protein
LIVIGIERYRYAKSIQVVQSCIFGDTQDEPKGFKGDFKPDPFSQTLAERLTSYGGTQQSSLTRPLLTASQNDSPPPHCSNNEDCSSYFSEPSPRSLDALAMEADAAYVRERAAKLRQNRQARDRQAEEATVKARETSEAARLREMNDPFNRDGWNSLKWKGDWLEAATGYPPNKPPLGRIHFAQTLAGRKSSGLPKRPARTSWGTVTRSKGLAHEV